MVKNAFGKPRRIKNERDWWEPIKWEWGEERGGGEMGGGNGKVEIGKRWKICNIKNEDQNTYRNEGANRDAAEVASEKRRKQEVSKWRVQKKNEALSGLY